MTNINTEEALRLEKRAKKNRWVAGILTLIFAPLGYVYTNRYRAAIIAFIIALPLYSLAEDGEEGETLLGFFAIGVTIENIVSINVAKNKIKSNNFPLSTIETTSSHQPKSLQVSILKAIQQKGEMTVSEIIVETEFNPSLVKETLLQLEKEQLIYGYNRDIDGVVVYKNI